MPSPWNPPVAVFLLLVTIVLQAHSKVDFRQTTSNKAFIGSLKDGEYEIVHPFQIREKNDRIGIDTRNYFLRGTEHFEQVTIVIRSGVLGRLKIVASRNDHLVLNQTAFRKLDTNGEHVISTKVENCFYQGSVAGDETSFAAFSSCNGLRGVIAFSNGSSYGIYPLDGGNRDKRHPHVLYKAGWPTEAKCGAAPAAGAMAAAGALVSHHKHRRDSSKQTKHVEMAVIGDYQFMLERASDESDAMMYMLEAINSADLMLSRDLNIRLCAVYVELWLDVQRVDLLADSAATLAGLVDYSAGHLYNIPKDATVLFTGGRFANDEVTTSAFRSICTARATMVVKAVDAFSPMWSGQLLAQSMGHTLGLDHDSASCACPNCIMNAKIGQLDSAFGWQFSKCSIARVHGIWQSGHVHCLLNKPFQESTLRSCGNGVVEGAEECDCGSRDTCADACCDPLTCTLKAHAQCASHNTCCQRCQLLPAGTECRASRGACDVVETCDGRSGDCPIDGHLVDGSACGEEGTCWRGNCSDPIAQCQALWGKAATVAEAACFDQNTQGYEYANCGEKPCTKSDAKCGLLHCQGGAETSLSNTRSFAFSFLSHEGKSVQCKTVADAPLGLVRDGTGCGPGRVCVGTSCVEMMQVSSPVSCPTNNVALACSGHGDCTTAGKCVCIEGWDGEACDSRSSRKKTPMGGATATLVVPSLAAGKSLDTGTLLLILLGVGLFLLLLLVCLLFCYRRRSHVEIPLPSDEKSIDIPENQRTIKFGSMPSYREDKRKRKSNKRIYGALNRITEADERDSASLRSRESALLAEGTKAFPSSRSDFGGYGEREHEHVYAASVIGLGRREREREEYPIDDFPSFPFRPPLMDSAASPSLSRTLLDREGHSHLLGRGVHSSASSSSFPDGAPLRLTQLLQQLRTPESEMEMEMEGGLPDPPRVRYPLDEDALATEVDLEHAASNTESSRAGESPNQGTSSVDGSLNPQPSGGSITFRNSPSLFSDPFRLEMATSTHN
ncbi:hypothetical protein PMAYCL1PPCAC_12054 [Pristionchus mayeri]|uniref:Unc-71 n=1 Tax=Pristionchus mayeri TaxID=1317129 RepID=A0AAN4ZL31_9BILA|nr:hypothetical protein PMAYCL1PPCAC_12054 [Pristionchus mayeri]